MITSENGIALIKKSEGFVAHPYDDNGKQAIGYGHDFQPGEDVPVQITEAQADTLLRQDLAARIEPFLTSLVPPACTQNQFDALADFGYNLGPGALRMMLGHGWQEVPTQMVRWCNISGKPSPGLLARRQREVALFNS
jgi:lysozyme